MAYGPYFILRDQEASAALQVLTSVFRCVKFSLSRSVALSIALLAPAPPAMPVFSDGRDAVFTSPPKVRLTINGFPDFYALLAVSRDASHTELEEAIVSRGADLLTASFARGGRPELLVLLERHMNDFRPVLLNKVTRIAYDEQLRRHETEEQRAMEFEVWKQSHSGGSRLSQRIQDVSRGIKERVKAAFWDAEYF